MIYKAIYERDVSRETFFKVEECFNANAPIFQELISIWLWWNESINLFSRNISPEILTLHIKHSLILCHLNKYSGAIPIVDAGTGGGLPGFPLALMNPSRSYYLVDSNFKKHTVLKHISSVLNLKNVHPVRSDIHSFCLKENFQIISKHAFSLIELQRVMLRNNLKDAFIFKGNDFRRELNNDFSEHFSYNIFHLHSLTDFSPFFNSKCIIHMKYSEADE